MNQLYFGDNLHVMKKYIADDSVDLIYLDPPFNSKADYNVLFKASSARGHRAQIEAFEDTWHWGTEAEEALNAIRAQGGPTASIVRALREALGPTDMMAYIVMMSVRIIELHRILKETGSLYLHCDSNASHYLRTVMDGIFGPQNFRNEIIWRRTNAHNMKINGWPRSSDTLLFYTKSASFHYQQQYAPYEAAQLSRFKPDQNGRMFKAENLTFSTVRRHRQFEWRGVKPPPHRSWGADLEQLENWFADGRILLKQDGSPRLDGLKVYLDDLPGKTIDNIWTDIDRVSNTGGERLGYPTQKPLALLERIISASSKPGDVILDPFCGCGTAVHAAQASGRNWIGIDITHLAIQVIADRLSRWTPAARFEIVGQPRDLSGAEALARLDKYQFQWWATWLCGGQPAGGGKKGADGGVDGTLEFATGRGQQDWGIVSVKGGKNVGVDMVRQLEWAVRNEKAAMGVLVTLVPPTREMEKAAVTAGFVELGGADYPRIQIRTVEQLLDGQAIKSPFLLTTVQQSPAKSTRGAGSRVALSAEDALAQRNILLPIPGGRMSSVQPSLELQEPLLSAQFDRPRRKRA